MLDNERKRLDEQLNHILSHYQELREPMQYSLFGGGKRFRPLLLLAFLKDYDMDIEYGIDIACAIEMIHTYSLIHDDLPAMDNDEMRRGIPTNHVKFGENVAVLAGDALLTEAFFWMASAPLSEEQKIRIIQSVAKYCGASGMIRGQYLDIKNTENTESNIDLIHLHKTHDLIAAAVDCALIIANQKSESWRDFSIHLGKAFQMKDDLDDVDKEEETSMIKAVGVKQTQNLFFMHRTMCLKMVEEKLGMKEVYQLVESIL